MDLYDEIQINGYNKAICNKIFIRGIYEELVFDKENIEELDSEITSLRNLKLLRLNHNSIQKIANIPPNLKELSLYYNLTISIHEKIHQENLLFLGLGYNLLTNDAIGFISPKNEI